MDAPGPPNVPPRPIALLFLSLAACGGGGGGGGEGADAAEVSSTPGLLATVPWAASAAAGGLASGFPGEADFFQDELHLRVYDRALTALRPIDELLQGLAVAYLAELRGQGPYLAQLDLRAAERGQTNASVATERGRSHGERAPLFELWTVEVEEEGAEDVVRIWSDPNGDSATGHRWRATARLRAGVSAARPFGDLRLDFLRLPFGATSPAQAELEGSLVTASVGKQASWRLFLRAGNLGATPAPGERAEECRVHVRWDTQKGSGVAKVHQRERFDDGSGDSGVLFSEHLFAFDAGGVTRRTNGVSAALLPSAAEELVWSYRLYEAEGPDAGRRVERAQGFGFRTEDDAYAWFGAHGPWLPDSVAELDGDSVRRDVWAESGEERSYTVEEGQGRLLRLTREQSSLAAVTGLAFERVVHDAQAGASTVQLVEFDGFDWRVVGTVDPDTGLTTARAPLVLDVAQLGSLSLWSDRLGGAVGFVHGDGFVSVYATALVSGDDPVFAGGTSVELFGLIDAPGAALSRSELEEGDVFLSPPSTPATAYRYLFDADAGRLDLDENGDGSLLHPVGGLPGVTPRSGPYREALRSGPLVADPGSLASTADVWRAQEIFVYEVGSRSWNRSFELRDELGGLAPREAALRFVYTHSGANDRNGASDHAGEVFVLEYRGDGELVGIPREEREGRFVPIVNLADGVELVSGAGERYVVRALELEQHLRSGAAGPSVVEASDLLLPDATLLSTPDVSDPPPVGDAPRVLAGS